MQQNCMFQLTFAYEIQMQTGDSPYNSPPATTFIFDLDRIHWTLEAATLACLAGSPTRLPGRHAHSASFLFKFEVPWNAEPVAGAVKAVALAGALEIASSTPTRATDAVDDVSRPLAGDRRPSGVQ